MDMPLDDMIRSRRNNERGRGQGRSMRGRGTRGGGQNRSFGSGRMTDAPRSRAPPGLNARPSSFSIAKSFRSRARTFPWQRDLVEDSLRAVGISSSESGTKLYISNLDFGVTNEDIRELFSEMGELTRYAVHYDKNGRSSGSSEVVFARRSDAIQALKRYNNIQLDGKPMKIEIIGTNSEIPVSTLVNVVGGVNGRRTVVMPGSGRGRGSGQVNRASGPRSRGGLTNGRGGFANGRGGGSTGGRGGSTGGRGGGWGRGRGRVRGGGGRGRGRGRKKPIEKSAEDLDKELENYHAGAMET
ncbi:THO complex subunit 4D [Impatiens glandulifera]|uniref:THO complex subunit 4D n=1 Tax=Impatiens glandulifera TaxID=253017 RepID=UPI001FB16EFE|nr:THO complex subunit 4D [Impatiens glandulifera]